jgi:hypothetical protein
MIYHYYFYTPMRLLSLLALVFCFSFVGSPAFAQEVAPSDQSAGSQPQFEVVGPDLYLSNFQIDKETYAAGETVKGSLSVENKQDRVVDNLYYEVSLVGQYDETNVPAIHHYSKQYGPVRLSSHEVTTINFQFPLADSIGGKELGIEVQFFTADDLPLQWIESHRTTITGGIPQLSIEGTGLVMAGGLIVPVTSGPVIYKEKSPSSLELGVYAVNKDAQDIKVTPHVSIWLDDVNGDPLHTFTAPSFVTKAGTSSRTTFVLPDFNFTPGVYVGKMMLLDDAGKPRASQVFFRYIIAGNIANINDVTTETQEFKKGGVADIKVSYTGAPYDFLTEESVIGAGAQEVTVEVGLYNKKNQLIGSTSSKVDVSAGDSTTLQVPLTKDSTFVGATVKIVDASGKVLDEYSSVLLESPESKNANVKIIVLALLALVIALLLVWWLIKKGRKVVPVAIAVLLFFILAPSASANCNYIGGTTRISGINYGTASKNVGDSFNVSASISIKQCKNTPARIKYSATTEGVKKENNSANWSSGCGSNFCSTQQNSYSNRSANLSVGQFIVPNLPGTTRSIYIYAKNENGGCSDSEDATVYYTIPAPVVNGACGLAATSTPASAAPSTNLCSTGTASAVTTNTSSYDWSCAGSNGGTSATCNVPRQTAAVSATCSASPSSPLTGQAVTWSASVTGGTGTNTYQWSEDGGSSVAGTSATIQKTYTTVGSKNMSVKVTSGSQNSGWQACPAVLVADGTVSDGVCGNAAHSYAAGEELSGSYCSSGTPNPSSPSFGGSDAVTWTCNGTNGGNNSGACTATRSNGGGGDTTHRTTCGAINLNMTLSPEIVEEDADMCGLGWTATATNASATVDGVSCSADVTCTVDNHTGISSVSVGTHTLRCSYSDGSGVVSAYPRCRSKSQYGEN